MMRVLSSAGDASKARTAFLLNEFRPVSIGIVTRTFRVEGGDTVFVRFQAAMITADNRVIEIGRQHSSRTQVEDDLAAALAYMECDHD